jgi:hypothetical protein
LLLITTKFFQLTMNFTPFAQDIVTTYTPHYYI